MPADLPPIRFATSGGARLACQAIGDGPVDIVAIPPMAPARRDGVAAAEIRYLSSDSPPSPGSSISTSLISTDLDWFGAALDDAAIVAAYGGDLLPEDIYEDWTAPFRDAGGAERARQAWDAAVTALDD